jgi:hypothetical protein
MITRHIANRKPKGRHFAWSRKVEMDGALITYRLWRRDHLRKLHQVGRQYDSAIAPRRMIACDLRISRKLLRDRVDEIDLAAMEIAA